MDSFDLAILACLEADGRQSFGAIAEQVSLSKTPCWTRVQSLEASGVIKGYRAVIDPHALGLRLVAFVQVKIEFGRHAEFEQAVRDHAAIIECFTIAGEEDYLLQVLISDVEQLDRLLREDLCRLPGVQRFSTTICLKRIKDNGPITRAAALR
jgi:Lrp/AsnC family leucine-responsive transcriptional regulator